MNLIEFKKKRVLIMGLGLHGGGVGSAAFFAKLGSRIIITDIKTKKDLAPSLAQLRRFKNITYHLGGHRTADFKNADYIIKGPGVPENSKFLMAARSAGVPILSDVEIFFRVCPAPIIGITGTKGKSTATWLLGQLLKEGLRKRIWVGGNIRKSVLEFLHSVRKGDLVVLELSSFQLDSLKNSRMSPHIALITNIFPDHLNRYPSLAAYVASKANIFKFQQKDDCLFINSQDPLLRRLAKRAPGRVIRFDPDAITFRFRRALPLGLPDYHFPNVSAAIAIARHLGVGDRAIRAVLKKFRGLPSRMQLVDKVRGVEFINDTTATNPTAAERAVETIKKRIGRGRQLHVIAGGYDKGLPVRDFVRALRRYAATVIFLPGGASKRMKSEIPRPRPGSAEGGRNPKSQTNHKSKIPKSFDAKTMPQAVAIACRNARPGDVVLLSPGAASFGLFRHEFDRGDQFVEAVGRLQ